MFQRQMANGFVIESVSLSQATVAEALKFKKQLELDIELGYKIIVVDLSNCQSIDNAFMGVLVIVLKQLMRLGGSLKILKPGLFSDSLLNITGTIEIFEIYESIENVMASISTLTTSDNNYNSTGLEQLAIAQ
ncbi:MAG: STAS domain-containing protein [Ignavibacteriales bacterium]|mgnify:CR=1 FL=1|nr:STAS domain-containing protein [Ignavibacteriales bacterium]